MNIHAVLAEEKALIDEALAADSALDLVALISSEQLAGDGEAVSMQELTEVDGPVARILMSCRCSSSNRCPLAKLGLLCR
jgi:hypothetical protein